jgi:hypothetical protein
MAALLAARRVQAPLALRDRDTRGTGILVLVVTLAVALDLIRRAIGLALAIRPSDKAGRTARYALSILLDISINALAQAAVAFASRQKVVFGEPEHGAGRKAD